MKVAALALGSALAVVIPSLYLLSPRPRRQASSAFVKPASATERLAAAVDELKRLTHRPPCNDSPDDDDNDCYDDDGLRAPSSFNDPRLFCASKGFTADGWSGDRKAVRGIDGSVTCSGLLELWANVKKFWFGPLEKLAKCCCEDQGSCCKETLAGECAPRDATLDWEEKFVVISARGNTRRGTPPARAVTLG